MFHCFDSDDVIEEAEVLGDNEHPLASAVLSHDGKRVFAVYQDGTARFWKMPG